MDLRWFRSGATSGSSAGRRISAAIEKHNQIIAEADAAKTGGLVGALAISPVLTEKLTLAGRRSALMEAKYGGIRDQIFMSDERRVLDQCQSDRAHNIARCG
ncbi:hypothetical protein [Paracoccus aminophilus]|nr:hypothetical protein [Paracoccus aminophilus]